MTHACRHSATHSAPDGHNHARAGYRLGHNSATKRDRIAGACLETGAWGGPGVNEMVNRTVVSIEAEVCAIDPAGAVGRLCLFDDGGAVQAVASRSSMRS